MRRTVEGIKRRLPHLQAPLMAARIGRRIGWPTAAAEERGAELRPVPPPRAEPTAAGPKSELPLFHSAHSPASKAPELAHHSKMWRRLLVGKLGPQLSYDERGSPKAKENKKSKICIFKLLINDGV